MKNKKIKIQYCIIFFFLLINIGCGKKRIEPVVVKPAFKPHSLIWCSANERPSWIDNEPEKDGDKLCFTGLSEYHATESEARATALRNATTTVVSYVNTSVKNIYREISVRYGQSSDIADPTRESKELNEVIKNSIISRVKASNYYTEQWRNAENEPYWKVYVLVKVPEDAIKNAVTRTTQDYEQAIKLDSERKQEEAKLEAERKAEEQKRKEKKNEMLQDIFKKVTDKFLEKIDKKKNK